MITELLVREHNKQVHYDIEKDLQKKRNGLFTFILKVNCGSITDYVLLETSDYEKGGAKPIGVPRLDRK